jgi:hypothetical protein
LDGEAEAGDRLGRLEGDRTVREVCREYGIAETLSAAGVTSCWRAA